MKEVCVLVFLCFNSWLDLKKKEISLGAAGILGAAGLILAIKNGKPMWEFLVPLCIAGFFLGVSVLTRGSLGMGDCWLLMALGTVLETDKFLTVLLFGLLACAVWAGGMLALSAGKRDGEIPFVPFLLMGYIGGLILW